MIILTGASGFIGRRLAVRLATEYPGELVLCLVKQDEDVFCQTGVSLLRSHSLQPIPTDLVSGCGLEGLQSPKLVFHLAANTHTWEGDHRCNDLGTEKLLRAVQPLGPKTHLVFTSTTAVMDNREDLERPIEAVRAVELTPLSAYGRSKWRAEQFLRAEAAKFGFRLSIVRLCTVYGPEPRPNTLFAVMKREVARESLVARLDWPGLTSFIHVEDVVSCLLRLGGITGRDGVVSARSVAESNDARIGYEDDDDDKGVRMTGLREGGPAKLNFPSPQPSPRAEGEAKRAVATLRRSAIRQLTGDRSPSPWGEGWGEGEPGIRLPEPGETRTYLLATESRTLAYVSRLFHAAQGLPYRKISLPDAAWKLSRAAHALCRCGAGRLPVWLFNSLWRFNAAVNPLFHCNTKLFQCWFPEISPRLIADSVEEI